MKLVVKRFDELTAAQLHKILKTRVSIFVVEQECPYQDVDDTVCESLHIWLEENGEIKAYLRLFPKADSENTAHIGRVLATERRKGYATQILDAGIKVAKEVMKADRIYLEAQTYALGLYLNKGFAPCGEEFLEDGIPHTPMMKEI